MTTDNVQAVVAVLTLLTTIFLTILVYRSSDRIARLEYGRAIRDAWIALDTTVLSDDVLLETADRLIDPTSTDTIDVCRKKWVAYMILNPLLSGFEGRKKGVLEKKYVNNSLEQTLITLISDNDVYSLTQTKGYPEEFAKHCKKLRGMLNPPV